jgi:hypothetical protein
MTLTVAVPPKRLLTTPPMSLRLQQEIWSKLRWTPHPLQYQVLTSRARQSLLSAGRRVGKSQTGGYKLVPEAFRALAERKILEQHRLRREYWIVGPEYSDAEKEFRVVWDALKLLGFDFDKPGSYNNPESGDMHISMFGRKFIISAKSAKYPGTLVGEGLSGIVFSEAAKLKPSVYNKFLRPTLADFGGWAFFGSTPEGRNWFYDFWNIGQDVNRLDWSSFRAPAWANPHVYPGGVDERLLDRLIEARRRDPSHGLQTALRNVEMLQTEMGLAPAGIDPEIWSLFLDMSIEMFNQEIAALFTEFVGRVFKDFDEEYHVNDIGFRPGWRTFACADYGFTNPFVWLVLQIDPHNERIHVVAEYYERGRTTAEAAAEIQQRGLAGNRGDYRILRFYPDPSEPDRTRELQSKLEISAHGGGSIKKEDRIEWIRRFLKPTHPHLDLWHPERAPKLTINRNCKMTIREMNIWKYPETAEQAAERGRGAPEEPQKKDDHTPEALGRFFSGYFGRPWAGRGGARQTKAKVGRQ